jgi:hypothetical protein
MLIAIRRLPLLRAPAGVVDGALSKSHLALELNKAE